LVERRDIQARVAATGKINPAVGAEVRVGSRISGRVQRLYANVGDVVRRDQLIAELEKNDLLALHEQRRAEFSVVQARLSSVEILRPKEILKAEAALADAEAATQLAEADYIRQQAMFRDGLIPAQSLDAALKDRDVMRARVLAARREVDLAGQRYETDLNEAKAQVTQAAAVLRVMEAQLSYAEIRAPIGGVVGSVSTQEGETVAAGLSSPTFVTIIDLKKLQVDAFVDETDIGKIRTGQVAVFAVDSFPNRDFQASVAAIYPKAVIMDNVVYYDVVLRIDEPLTGGLRPEMTANVLITLDARSGALTVPVQAVRRDQGKNVVYLERNGQLVRQVVQVGVRDGERVEVINGLREGERVLMRRAGEPAAGGIG
jgi:multidrug resistance efflux pump